jgi:hypothetical protein
MSLDHPAESLQPQLRLCRPLEAPLPPQKPLPPGHAVRPYAPGDEAAWAKLLHENRLLGDWDEARIRAMIECDSPELLLDGTFFVLRGGEFVATACTRRHQARTPDRELLEIAHWQPRVAADVFILTDDWRVPAIVTYLRLRFRPEIVHPNQLERWRRLAEGFAGDLRRWATPYRA